VCFEAAALSYPCFEVVLNGAKERFELVKVGAGCALGDFFRRANFGAGSDMGELCDVRSAIRSVLPLADFTS